MQSRHQFLDLLVAFGPDIGLRPRRRGNRIDAEAAFDDSHVHSHLRRRARIERPLVDKERDGAAQRVDRIPDPEIAPAMAAWPGKGNFEAPAPERLPRDVVGRRSVQHQKCGDALQQFRLPADMTDSTEVSLALLPDVRDQ